MTDRFVVVLSRTVAVIGAALSIIAATLTITGGVGEVLLSEGGAFVLFSVFFAVVVWLVVPLQPRNPVLWIMAATAFFAGGYLAAWAGALDVAADPSVLVTGDYIPADHPKAVAWLLLMGVPLGTGAVVVQLTFGLLLFPDGRLPSPRWRWVGAVSVGATALLVLGLAWDFRPENQSPAEGGAVVDVGGTAVVIAAVLSVLALGNRFRRSTGTTRQQLKWVMWGSGILVLSLVTVTFFEGTSYEELFLAVFALAAAAFVTSYGIALGKYRLYDIDVVISRTVVYGTLGLFITGVYVAAVVGLGNLLGGEAGSRPWLSIGATALVAFAFEPLRERLQRLANRLVYGRRATPYEVLSDFSRMITGSDGELLIQVARSLAEGTTAQEAAVWVRREGTLERVAVWPPDDEPDPMRVAEGATPIPGADVTKTVIHDGERLGLLTLSAARGQTVLPTDERLLEQMAAGMGLALRNIRLGEDLREQVEELRQSRQRLVTVQDETRRHLERQLHDGVQQRLVALKVRLSLAKRGAAASGMDEVAGLLDHVSVDTDQAIDSLRDFARGIYPPLLESEGLAAALASQVLKLPIEITVHAPGVGRHPRPVEAAVYFCVLEALQNVVKHAGASSAHVAIRQDERSLTFEISDDGKGFDPSRVSPGSGLSNLADRLDALDGAVEIISSPGQGTTVRGSVPSKQLEMVP